MSLDFRGLNDSLLARARDVLLEWFPQGKFIGTEFVAGGTDGRPGDSLSINWKKGVWKDFESGEGGADLISLYASRNGMTQGQAFKDLAGPGIASISAQPTRARKREPEPEPQQLPPEDASRPTFVHFKHGAAVAVYEYLTKEGALIGYISRHEPPGMRKQFIPWTWSEHDAGWKCAGFTDPRPLYGLDALVGAPDKSIVLVEGEKAAEAAKRIVGHLYIPVTWPGGAAAVNKVDWSPLAGRRVIVWPDADDAGIRAAQTIADLLSDIAGSVKIIDVSGMPDKWDAADAAQEGMAYDTWVKWAKPRLAKYEPKSTEEKEGAEKAGLQDRVELWNALGLELAGEGKGPIPNLDNVCRVLERWDGFSGAVWYDTFREKILTRWDGADRREWTDNDDLRLTRQVQSQIYIPRVSVETVHQALSMTAFKQRKNELVQWLDGLEWDRLPRLEALLSAGFGATDKPYHSEVGKCWLLGMVARAYRPGCKVDTMPILEGSQGTGKSSALRVLGGEWFAECHESVTTKDFYQVLKGAWLVEISEMHSFDRSEVERIKGIISCAVDRYRAPYGRNAEDHPRQSVFAGTTNRDDWQRDDTGARRFWAVRCGIIDTAWLAVHRDQLFAEAVARFRAGESWWSVPSVEAAAEADERRPRDTWEDALRSYLDDTKQYGMQQLLENCLDIPLAKQDRVAQLRTGSAMRALGWEPRTLRRGLGQTIRVWAKI
jgi:predicted P-loop ATPase